MELKHTPGPWVPHEQGEANQWVLLTPTGKWVLAFMQNGEIWNEQQKANVKLIAAAPEMLQALIDVRRQILNAGIPDGFDNAFDNINKLLAKALPNWGAKNPNEKINPSEI